MVVNKIWSLSVDLSNIDTIPNHLGKQIGQKIIFNRTDKFPQLITDFNSVICMLPNSRVTTLSHTQIKVEVIGLKDNLELLKNLTQYIQDNQKDFVNLCYRFTPRYSMKDVKKVKSKMWNDNGRLMPDWLCTNLIQSANTCDEFFSFFKRGKDITKPCRPRKYAIHIEKEYITFNCFRGTKSPKEISDLLTLVDKFINEGLINGRSFLDIFNDGYWSIPKMVWNPDEFEEIVA